MWPVVGNPGLPATGESIGNWAPGYWSPTPVAGANIGGVGAGQCSLGAIPLHLFYIDYLLLCRLSRLVILYTTCGNSSSTGRIADWHDANRFIKC
jgi:hypothetical protein